MKSKIVIFHKAGEPLQITECAIPSLQPGEILIKNEYATLCRSDISTYTGKRIEKTPTILGHEISGRVAALGPGTPASDLNGNPLRIGERVTWAIYAASPDSEMARKGIPQKSPDLFKYGHEQVTAESTLHGGLAEYIILRRHTPVLPLPADIPLPVGSIINCAVATVAGSLRLAGEVKGRNVIVRGAGMLGLIACAMCKEKGAAKITAVDIDNQRLATALQFGASATYRTDDTVALPPSADVSIDYSGVPSAMEATVADLVVGGTAVWVGGVAPKGNVSLNPETVVRRLLSIKGLHNYNAADFREAVEFISAHHAHYPFSDLVYDGFSLEQAEDAFHYAIAHNPYRVGIHFARTDDKTTI